MALAKTDIGTYVSGDSFGTGVFTTGSFTPPDNSLLVVLVTAFGFGTSVDLGAELSVSGGGLTWTGRIAVGDLVSWTTGVSVFTAPVTTGASMTLDFDCGAEDVYNYVAQVFAFTDYDTGSPVGATASNATMATNGADALTLSASPASTSYVLGLIAINQNTGTSVATPDAGDGWAEVLVATGNLRWTQSIGRTGSTTTSVGWSDVATGLLQGKCLGVALEIKQSSGAAGGQPTMRRFGGVPGMGQTNSIGRGW